MEERAEETMLAPLMYYIYWGSERVLRVTAQGC